MRILPSYRKASPAPSHVSAGMQRRHAADKRLASLISKSSRSKAGSFHSVSCRRHEHTSQNFVQFLPFCTSYSNNSANSPKMEWCQHNGQRLYGPPVESGRKPEQGSEVFIPNVPQDWTEFDIFDLFKTIGPIYQVRMMVNFSGSTRGFCFVRFFEKEHASQAILELNRKEVKKGWKIKVVMSLDNSTLWVTDFPKFRTDEEIRSEIFRISNGVTSVTIFTQNKQRCCLIDYTTHSAASNARKLFLSRQVKLWGHRCSVEWAQRGDQPKISNV
ncbi:RNA-binding protein 47 [Folsomia candida]|uniref:APOBEC1 complementation factor n=1 Tax=Folsomia candida TaxID=158441 RepID=A0A226F697_FOLCA|nr:RNA-binding protein 47 [Folsomia candida]OXA65027.1 APOBEC1 complementation factor [Folsomia candida]